MLSTLEQGGISPVLHFIPRASPLFPVPSSSQERGIALKRGRKCQLLSSENFRQKGTFKKPRHRGQRDLSNPFFFFLRARLREGSGSQLPPAWKSCSMEEPIHQAQPSQKITSASPQCVPTWQLWGCNSSEPKIILCPEEKQAIAVGISFG